MNLTSLWSCRRFNRRLRSSLPGLHRAEGCEKPYGGTTIQGNMKQTAASHSLFFSLSWNSSFSVRRLLSPPFQLDICLQQDSAVYRSFRIKGSIGPMRVQLVAEGAFGELRKRMMAFSNTSPNTFKMHRVLHRKEYADFLLGKTISWNLLLRRTRKSVWTLWWALTEWDVSRVFVSYSWVSWWTVPLGTV